MRERRTLGWTPLIDLASGLQGTWSWYDARERDGAEALARLAQEDR